MEGTMSTTVTTRVPMAGVYRDTLARIHAIVRKADAALAAWDAASNPQAVVEELGRVCVELVEMRHDVHGVYHSTFNKMLTAEVPEPAEAGKILFPVWDNYIAALSFLHATVTTVATFRSAVPHAERLPPTIEKEKAQREYADPGW